MPRIEEYFDLEDHPDNAKRLAHELSVPEWFFAKVGWDANGFFGSQSHIANQDHQSSYVTFSRFLAKAVFAKNGQRKFRKDKPDATSLNIDYEWSYMGFVTIWRPRSQIRPAQSIAEPRASMDFNNSTVLLLCFDLPKHIRRNLTDALSIIERDCTLNPFQILTHVSRIVLIEFDESIWSFQPFVRLVEKTRFSFAVEQALRDDSLNVRYTGIHELFRHAIHITETASVAARTLTAMSSDQSKLLAEILNKPFEDAVISAASQIHRDLKVYADMMENFQARAQAFVDRLNNEAQLAFSIVTAENAKLSARDAKTSTDILEEVRNEGKALTETIAVFTLLFLPGTFVSGFFGMNFFTLNIENDETASWRSSGRLWIFFAVAGPITAIGFVLFALNISLIKLMRSWITDPLVQIWRSYQSK